MEGTSLLPQWFRTSSTVDLHLFRSGPALLPQWFFTSSAVVLYFTSARGEIPTFSWYRRYYRETV